MKCPRCTATMAPYSNHNTVVDVCAHSCGGIWFDWMEFKKMDEAHEADTDFLNQLSNIYVKPATNTHEKLDCPKCVGIKMMRRFASVKRQVEIDECPKCGGLWLDAGELVKIHTQFKTEDDRRRAADQMFNEMFGAEIKLLELKREERLEKFKKFRNAFRYICPSDYLKRNE